MMKNQIKVDVFNVYGCYCKKNEENFYSRTNKIVD
jgi:hypothetical protein